MRQSEEVECSIIHLDQDPILRPVRVLGCPPAEGQEISSFLEPSVVSGVASGGGGGGASVIGCAGSSTGASTSVQSVPYVYGGLSTSGIATEGPCYGLYNPDNIRPKSRVGSRFAKILERPNRAVKDVNRKVLAMIRAMTPSWSLRLLGVSCGSVVCAWGLLLILSVLGGGASHGTGTGIGSFGLGSLSGTMDDLNAATCPWACSCGGQEVDCSHRGLTQIPGDLAALLLAEKL